MGIVTNVSLAAIKLKENDNVGFVTNVSLAVVRRMIMWVL